MRPGPKAMDLEKLRQDAFANNLVWLRSFGCEIGRLGDALRVDHPDLPDYQAWLLFGEPQRALGDLARILAGVAAGGAPATVYVDERAQGEELATRLRRAGFRRALANMTVGGLVAGSVSARGLSLRAARESDLPLWSRIYSAGFGQSESDAFRDLRRWRAAFQSEPSLTHWFLIDGTEPVGVVQTCSAHDVVGIYSFTMARARGGPAAVRAALAALRAELASGGTVRLYFELLLKGDRGNRRRPERAPFGLTILRRMRGWRRPG